MIYKYQIYVHISHRTPKPILRLIILLEVKLFIKKKKSLNIDDMSRFIYLIFISFYSRKILLFSRAVKISKILEEE